MSNIDESQNIAREEGRPKTDSHWAERVRILTEIEGLGPHALWQRLEQEAAEAKRRDAPSKRMVARLRTEFLALDDSKRRAYRSFRWPESMGGDLPWEASGAALELVQLHQARGLPPPLYRLVEWYWRATLAASDAPLAERYRIASLLAATEIGGDMPGALRQVESFVAWAPWRSPEASAAYEAAITDRVDGVRTGIVDPAVIIDAAEAMIGIGLTPPQREGLADVLDGSYKTWRKVTRRRRQQGTNNE